MSKAVRMTIYREMKHSVRYAEPEVAGESDSEAIANTTFGTVYIRKTALPKPFPKEITVTLDF